MGINLLLLLLCFFHIIEGPWTEFSASVNVPEFLALNSFLCWSHVNCCHCHAAVIHTSEVL